ncbi:MAG: PD-(D/E)XK nuclease family transposase, partial [Spirochaetia bacterium]
MHCSTWRFKATNTKGSIHAFSTTGHAVTPKGLESPHTCFELRERREQNLVLSEHLAIHLLELPKFSGFTDKKQPSTPLERWVYTLQRVGTGDELMKKITENDEMISETERRYQEFVSDPAARRAALERDIWIRDRGQMIRDAREEGLEKGRDEGEQAKARHIAE